MTVFYVSPEGNDSSSGLSPTAGGADGTFATIARAVQAMEASPGADTLFIEGGTYAGTLNLTSADSGDSFVAYQNQQAVLTGGTPVSGWTQGANGVWQAHVSLSGVQQLVVDGVAQTEARFPAAVPSNPIEGGWLWAQALPSGNNQTQMAYKPSDFPAGMQPAAGEQVTVFTAQGYSSDVLTIKSVNTSTGVLTFDQPADYAIGPGSRYFISGAQSMLTPSSWYFNPSTQTIYYDAPAGFDGSNATVAGGDQTLVNLNGANNVTLQGLTFNDTTTTAATVNVTNAAVVLNSSTGAVVDSDTFTNVSQGVLVEGNSSGNTISNSAFSYTGTSAIALQPQTSNNTISNNTISQSGYEFATAGAIQMNNSKGNLITNNLIQNVPRFGIGENNWDPSITSGGNTIQYNTILNSDQATPDDGAIYLFSSQDPGALGDVIRNNNIQNTGGPTTNASGFTGQNQGYGIYLDNLASNAQIYGNFISGTSDGGVYLHGGDNNAVYDNVMLNNQNFGMELQTVNGYSMGGTKIYNNVIQTSTQGNVAISMDTSSINPSLVHGNIYYNSTGAAPNYNTTSLASFQGRGGDNGSSVVTSVNFADTAAGDYSFAAGSPALADGIPQLAFAQMGPSGTPGAVDPPAASLPAADPPAAGLLAADPPAAGLLAADPPAAGLPAADPPAVASAAVAPAALASAAVVPAAAVDPSTQTATIADAKTTSAPTSTLLSTPTPTATDTYTLADGHADSLTLTNANFMNVPSDTITVNGGDDRNRISAAAVTGSNAVIMQGGGGKNVLTAGTDTTMTGGTGANKFVLTSWGQYGPDTNTITNFVHGSDKLIFSDLGFDLGKDDGKGTSHPKHLASSVFSPNTDGTFAKPHNHFAYNAGTGQLYYDSAGSKAPDSAHLIATLTNRPQLTSSDLFYIV